MRRSLARAALVVAAGVLGCSSARPAAAPTPVPVAAAAPEPEPDLSPVPAPADLIGVARLNQPSALVDTLVTWTGLPVDWRAMLADDAPGADRILSLDAPADVVVALSPTAERTPEVQVAISIGLTSYDGALSLAKRQGKRLREVAPGVQRLSAEGESACAVARAIGPAPARLVCSPDPEHLESLLPYMVRGLPREAIGARDLHAELRLEPLRRRFATQLRQLKAMGVPMLLHELSLDTPAFDRALAEAVHGLADELLALSDDVTRIDLDLVRLDDQNLELSLALSARSDRSWLVSTLRGSAARSLTPPEAFWLLPAESDYAGFGASVDPTRLTSIRRTVRDLVIGFLTSEQLSSKTSDSVAGALDLLWGDDTTMSWAHGTTTDKPVAGSANLRERIMSRVGWYVVAIEKDAAPYRQRLDALAAALSGKELRAAVAKRSELGPEALPSLKPVPVQGLPKGSAEYRLVLPEALLGEIEKIDPSKRSEPPAKAPAPGGSATFTLLLVPDGARSWLVLAPDAKRARAQLELVRSGTAGTLATRQGLEPLRMTRALSGGFFTLNGLLSSVPGAAEVLHAAPARGAVPMPYWTFAAATGDPAVRWSIRVPRAVVRDLGASAVGLARIAR